MFDPFEAAKKIEFPHPSIRLAASDAVLQYCNPKDIKEKLDLILGGHVESENQRELLLEDIAELIETKYSLLSWWENACRGDFGDEYYQTRDYFKGKYSRYVFHLAKLAHVLFKECEPSFDPSPTHEDLMDIYFHTR